MTFFFLFLFREYMIIATAVHLPADTINVLSGVGSFSTLTIAVASKEIVASGESLLTIQE